MQKILWNVYLLKSTCQSIVDVTELVIWVYRMIFFGYDKYHKTLSNSMPFEAYFLCVISVATKESIKIPVCITCSHLHNIVTLKINVCIKLLTFMINWRKNAAITIFLQNFFYSNTHFWGTLTVELLIRKKNCYIKWGNFYPL